MPTSWRIYYRGGRVFDSSEGSWASAPADGVLAVVEVIGNARRIVSGGDYYRIDTDGEVICHETADAILHAIGHVPMSPIKFGWCVSATEMARTMRRIEEDF